MLKFLKNLFYIIALLAIAICVYIASLPSKFTPNYPIALDNVPKKMLEKQLVFFENWKNWAVRDTNTIKVQQSSDPLQSILYNKKKDKTRFKIENEQVLDSLIVQKIYTTGERTIQSLQWSIGDKPIVTKINLELNEELSMKDKIYNLMDWSNPKRDWLLDLHSRLPGLQQKLNKKASDYQITYTGETTFGPYHYVFLSSSGHVDNISKETQKHIIELEQYLAEHNVKISSSPFTIYNDYNENNGNVIFSTAIPIATQIYIPGESTIRYGSIDSTNVLGMLVTGNPKSTKALWDNFKLTDKATLNTMANKRFIINQKNRLTTEDYTQWKQTLYWEIAPKTEESYFNTADTIITIKKI